MKKRTRTIDISTQQASAEVRVLDCISLACQILNDYRYLAGQVMTDPETADRFCLHNFADKIGRYYDHLCDLGLEGDVARTSHLVGKIEAVKFQYIGNWKGRAKYNGFKKENDRAVREGWLTREQAKLAEERFLKDYKEKEEAEDRKYCYKFGCLSLGKYEFEDLCKLFGVKIYEEDK